MYNVCLFSDPGLPPLQGMGQHSTELGLFSSLSFTVSTFPLSSRGVVKTDSCLKSSCALLKAVWVLLLAAAILCLAARRLLTNISPKMLQTHKCLQFSHQGKRTLCWSVQECFADGGWVLFADVCINLRGKLTGELRKHFVLAAWVLLSTWAAELFGPRSTAETKPV